MDEYLKEELRRMMHRAELLAQKAAELREMVGVGGNDGGSGTEDS